MQAKTIPILLALLSVTGCSARAVYDNIQYNKRTQCARQYPLHSTAYEECARGTDKSYEQYRRELEQTEAGNGTVP